MPTAQKPNILVILTDQQSATMMRCAGNRYLNTPAMDRLAADGVRFERAYCTNPVCSPSRFSLLTGHMASEIGLRNNDDAHIDQIPQRFLQQALGHHFKAAGYRTAYGGKVHLPKGLLPEDLGFEVISHDERDGLAADCEAFLSAQHDQPFLLFASFVNPHDICYLAIREFADNEPEQAMTQADRVEIQEIDAALALAATYDPHAFFMDVCPPLPDNFDIPQDEPEVIRMMQQHRPFKAKARDHYTARQWRLHRWVYARLTERVDGQIHRILKALDTNGHGDNTTIIFTSDHGDMNASHRMEHKTAFYEEATRIPFIIAGSAVAHKNTVDTHLVSNGLDLVPTLSSLAELDPPSDCQGLNLMPLLKGTDSVFLGREALPVESELGRMILHKHYKYMRYNEGEHHEQLFNLLTDPGETRNALHDPENQAIRVELQALFEQAFKV